MGKIAEKFCDTIYLTDDNPRNENPKMIRKEIKKGIKYKTINEISDRKLAIKTAIINLKCSEILLIAGKGHETTQIYKNKVRFFSDKEIILSSIEYKNKFLSNNLKLNIIKESSKSNLSFKNLKIRKVIINSKEVNKDDIFFTIKGKKNDTYRYLDEVFKKRLLLQLLINSQKNHLEQNKLK